jgi:hypothetical protein
VAFTATKGGLTMMICKRCGKPAEEKDFYGIAGGERIYEFYGTAPGERVYMHFQCIVEAAQENDVPGETVRKKEWLSWIHAFASDPGDVIADRWRKGSALALADGDRHSLAAVPLAVFDPIEQNPCGCDRFVPCRRAAAQNWSALARAQRGDIISAYSSHDASPIKLAAPGGRARHRGTDGGRHRRHSSSS